VGLGYSHGQQCLRGGRSAKGTSTTAHSDKDRPACRAGPLIHHHAPPAGFEPALTAHMKRLCQVFAAAELGSCRCCGCLMMNARLWVGAGGRAGLRPGPDSCWAVRAAGPGQGGAERSRSDAAGALDVGCWEPIIGRSGQGLAAEGCGGRRRPGRVGVAYRGGMAAAATATLIYACRDRRSVLRRMVPLTPDESRGCGHSRDGDRSCSGERPGTPPA
jgi:hypothetical protein